MRVPEGMRESTTDAVRAAAVAGYFYPGASAELSAFLIELLAGLPPRGGARPRALIVPHAGYVYSGSTAAAAYTELAPWRTHIRRVLLLGPAHRVAIDGLALSSAAAFVTPLGAVAIDRAANARLRATPGIEVDDAAHAPEHALEVQLPFLQLQLADFTIVPLLVATRDAALVSDVLAPWWDDPQALIVVSTDLSHFLDYAGAQRVDARTDELIQRAVSTTLGPHDACGCRALNGLLHLAAERGADVRRVALCNSGDTAGTPERVVGYGAYVVR